MDLPTDPDEATHPLAEARTGEPTAWFDDLYRAAAPGRRSSRGMRRSPTCSSFGWRVKDRRPRPGPSSSGPGTGGTRGRPPACREYLSSLGYPTTAFDISPSAVEQTRARHPDSTVHDDVADLLALPRGWISGFDLVVWAHGGGRR
jgi:hypothetical protein